VAAVNRLALVSAAALVVATTAACGSTRQAVDAGVPLVGTQHGEVIDMPEGFVDVATACYHGTRIYVSATGDYAGSDVQVVPADPTCQEQP
jgi:hypothetical protein